MQGLQRARTPETGEFGLGAVRMLYGLFRIDLYALNYAEAIDVVFFSDLGRCQSLHMAALWCLLHP